MTRVSQRIIFIILMALIITIMPLPAMVDFIRPPCVLLTCLYLQWYMPHRFRLTLVMVLGLVMDALLSNVLGEHVFSLCLVAWLANSKVRRFSFFSISQQMAYVGIFAGIYQLNLECLDYLLGNQGHMRSVLGVSLVSSVIWPWISYMGESFLMRGVSYEI